MRSLGPVDRVGDSPRGIDVLGVADLPNDGDPPRLVRGEWPSLWVRRRWRLIGPECQQVGEGWVRRGGPVTPPCSRARDQREYGSEAHDGLDTLPVPAVSCRVSESERAVPSRAITEIERARVCFGVTDSIEGQEQHAPLEMMAPRVNPVRCVGAFGVVLLEQVENGLLCWRGHCWRARGCHESPPVRRSRRVPRAVGTAALMALLLRDENHHAVLVGLPSFEVWPDRGRPESDARRKQRRRNYGNDETIQHDAACACVSRGKLRQEALAVTADLQNKPRKPQSRWNSPPKPCRTSRRAHASATAERPCTARPCGAAVRSHASLTGQGIGRRRRGLNHGPAPGFALPQAS